MGLAVAAAAGLTAACQPAAETAQQAETRMNTESAAVKTIVDSLDKEFASHFNLTHADVVAAMYTEQGHLMAPNMAEAVGRDAIKASLAGMGAMKPQLQLAAQSVTANGPIAIERGTYVFTFTLPGMTAPMTDKGKYLVHWHQVGGHWLLADDIWNSDMPAMVPPAPPPPAPGKKKM
jgi:ketosteroid isomerase-like protein